MTNSKHIVEVTVKTSLADERQYYLELPPEAVDYLLATIYRLSVVYSPLLSKIPLDNPSIARYNSDQTEDIGRNVQEFPTKQDI